ncbi:hypothetical protein FB45DRAFT_1077286 [Roridomyces roridus]|uniref:Uncharacterized protein n=1 Tax=Roridomyces roridus TaxID=1738132 RepID=A0AAD7CJI7_9AGAR|nr:hypothetical protein FB45DRAFT_1077286 [Roridomyces roridus]
MATTAQKKEAQKYVGLLSVLAVVNSLDDPGSSAATSLVAGISKIHTGLKTIDSVISFALEKTVEGTNGHLVWLGLRNRVRQHRQAAKLQSGMATHRQKRKLISSLLLHYTPRRLSILIENSPPRDEPTHFLTPRIVFLERRPVVAKRGAALVERDFDFSGYYTVPPDESVIFVDPKTCRIELAVLRGIALGAPESNLLYRFIRKLIQVACDERRNVRPTHNGTMVQIGWNAGPRHARIFGLAKSYTKKIDGETAIDHDLDAIAALNLTWNFAKSFLPEELIGEVTRDVEESGLPKMATWNVPEGLLTQNYSSLIHADLSHARFTISWTAAHEPDPAAMVSSQPTRARTRQSKAVPTVHNPQLPHGGNFVDLSLKVLVQQATGTLLAHCPEYLHGTTELAGIHACGITIPFTLRVKQQFDELVAKGTHVMHEE